MDEFIQYLIDQILYSIFFVCLIPDDLVFERFLFGCKNSLEAAKLKLDQYYTARATMPEYFAERDPYNEELKEALKTV